MATQGILSIVVNGKVVAKAITGLDGQKMPAIAADVRKYRTTTASDLFNLCLNHGLGGESLIVQESPSKYLGGCDDDDDELSELYADNFNNPTFNPRWEYGTADYVEVVEVD